MSNIMDELSREIEQHEAGMEGLAKDAGIFWNELRKQGMTRKEATELTGVWMNSMILSALNINTGNKKD